MKFCTNCGSKVNEGVDVCSNCGQPLTGDQQGYTAPVEDETKTDEYSYQETSEEAKDTFAETADYTHDSFEETANQTEDSFDDATAGAAAAAAGTYSSYTAGYQGDQPNPDYANQNPNQQYADQNNQQYQNNQYTQGQYQNYAGQQGGQPVQAGGPGRNIAIAVILSIVTCGIYSLIWMYQLDEETARMTGEEPKGAMLILLSIVTCGIYMFIWYYKMGSERMKRLTGKDNGVLYILLAIFGLSIVNLCLIQSDLNALYGTNDF